VRWATCLSCAGKHYIHYVGNLVLFPTVKKNFENYLRFYESVCTAASLMASNTAYDDADLMLTQTAGNIVVQYQPSHMNSQVNGGEERGGWKKHESCRQKSLAGWSNTCFATCCSNQCCVNNNSWWHQCPRQQADGRWSFIELSSQRVLCNNIMRRGLSALPQLQLAISAASFYQY